MEKDIDEDASASCWLMNDKRDSCERHLQSTHTPTHEQQATDTRQAKKLTCPSEQQAANKMKLMRIRPCYITVVMILRSYPEKAYFFQTYPFLKTSRWTTGKNNCVTRRARTLTGKLCFRCLAAETMALRCHTDTSTKENRTRARSSRVTLADNGGQAGTQNTHLRRHLLLSDSGPGIHDDAPLLEEVDRAEQSQVVDEFQLRLRGKKTRASRAPDQVARPMFSQTPPLLVIKD